MSFLIGQTIGDYTILQQLGSGGSAVVYKVEQTITGRREAMKVLASGTGNSSELTERFIREIRLQASLSHPNIAAVHNAFLANDDLVLICELLHGESLGSLLERGRLPIVQGVNIVSQVLAALTYAHAHGVMHRDISPANIFVTTDKIVKLIDFGLAKSAVDVRLSREGTPLGSVHYMSPEQVRGVESLDVRTDIYSCGAVLYHLATGRTMFESDSEFDIMKGHLEGTPESPRSICPQIPEGLESIILRAVKKKPEDRFQSADSFLQALELVRVSECQAEPTAAAGSIWKVSSKFATASACLSLGLALFASPTHIGRHENTLQKRKAISVGPDRGVAAVVSPAPVPETHSIPALVRPGSAPKPLARPVRSKVASNKVVSNKVASDKVEEARADATTLSPHQTGTPVSDDDATPPDSVIAGSEGPVTDTTTQKPEHTGSKIGRSLQRLNPFSRKTPSDKQQVK